MTTIDFYFNAEERLQVACRLAGRAVARGTRLLIYAPQPELAQKIDRLLWTWPATGFVPHCLAEDALASETPVLITAQPESVPSCEVLLNLSDDCPDFFARHERLLEIVTCEDADRVAGRARYAWYRARGYPIRSHDLAAKGVA